MANGMEATDQLPRIVPRPGHIKALEGSWALDGDLIRMYEEPGSGVLMAQTEDGRTVNPLKVISRGKKLSV